MDSQDLSMVSTFMECSLVRLVGEIPREWWRGNAEARGLGWFSRPSWGVYEGRSGFFPFCLWLIFVVCSFLYVTELIIQVL